MHVRLAMIFQVVGDQIVLKLHQIVAVCLELVQTPNADLPFPPTIENVFSTPLHDQVGICVNRLTCISHPAQLASLTMVVL